MSLFNQQFSASLLRQALQLLELVMRIVLCPNVVCIAHLNQSVVVVVVVVVSLV